MNSKTKLTILLLSIFLLGVCTGFVGNEQVLRWRFARFERNPETLPQRITDRLTQKLDLTAEQQTAIHAIFTQAGTQFKAHREKVGEEIAALRNGITEQIMAVLTPEQQPLYQAHKAEREARHAKRKPPHR